MKISLYRDETGHYLKNDIKDQYPFIDGYYIQASHVSLDLLFLEMLNLEMGSNIIRKLRNKEYNIKEHSDHTIYMFMDFNYEDIFYLHMKFDLSYLIKHGNNTLISLSLEERQILNETISDT